MRTVLNGSIIIDVHKPNPSRKNNVAKGYLRVRK